MQIADSRHVGKYSKYYNSPTIAPTETQSGWSHNMTYPTRPQ